MSDSLFYVFRDPDPATDHTCTPNGTADVIAFHRTVPGYAPTPMACLDGLAKHLGVGRIFVKDESHRFGLNAFKALGASYAIGRELTELLGLSELCFPALVTPEAQKKIRDMTFVTATDGNHGRGVAWAAKLLHAKSTVLMPKGSARERLENIRAQGATAWITDCNYDDTVRLAAKEAHRVGGTLVQDTSWDGYQRIPQNIIRGYTTMGHELLAQLPESPTHLFLQAGVGTMAGAMAAFFKSCYPEITVAVLEPLNAACLYETARCNDGALHSVTGDLQTIMAGLACGEPCPLAWELLRRSASCFVALPEWVTAQGMRALAHPVEGDTPIISGESGAVSTGFVYTLMTDPRFAELKEKLGLNESSRVLCISTEGATHRETYTRIVEHGAFAP